MEPQCRLCAAPLSRAFVDLGMSPLSNAYLQADQLHSMEPFYPLRVYVCCECLLVQLPAVETREHIFDDHYAYFSSYSSSWLAHCKRFASEVIDERRLDDSSLVVEVASNDGYLLQYFKEAGVPVLGVEPAASVARVARKERGIPTEQAFFGRATAQRLRDAGKSADLIVGNNVLAHVPDLRDFLAGVQVLLQPNGICTFEFPHLLRLIEQNQFDTVYHEHYSYLSLYAAKRAFEEAGLRVFDVRELPTHGGSLRVYASHAATGSPKRHERVRELLAVERGHGLLELEGYAGFEARVNGVKRDLLEHLIAARRKGEHVAAYGAAAKGNTLLNYCGIRGDLIDYVVDRSPHKQGLYLPGTHIPIHAPEQLARTKPTTIVILPWNLRDEILDQLAYVREWSAQLVIPVPCLEVIT